MSDHGRILAQTILERHKNTSDPRDVPTYRSQSVDH